MLECTNNVFFIIMNRNELTNIYSNEVITNFIVKLFIKLIFILKNFKHNEFFNLLFNK